jgi:membrane protease YdiL (CAAX protease family)
MLAGDERDPLDGIRVSTVKVSHIWLFAAVTAFLSLAGLLLLPGIVGPLVVVFIPTVVSIALIRWVDGPGQARALLFSSSRWRVTYRLGLILLGLALVVRVGVGLVGGAVIPGYVWEIGVFLFAAAEEIGWRGFALPALMARGYRPLTATLLLGIPWAVLHLPLVMSGRLNDGWSPWAMLLFMMALSVIVSWSYLTGGFSILAAVLFHGGQNALSFLNDGIDARGSSWVMAGVYGVVALSILVVNGGRLGVPRSGTDAILEAQTESRVQY